MTSPIKTVVAVLCVLGAVFVGLPLMVVSELQTNTGASLDVATIYNLGSSATLQLPAIHHMITDGLKPYCLGFGVVLFLVAIAFVLLDGEDKIATLKGSDTDS